MQIMNLDTWSAFVDWAFPTTFAESIGVNTTAFVLVAVAIGLSQSAFVNVICFADHALFHVTSAKQTAVYALQCGRT